MLLDIRKAASFIEISDSCATLNGWHCCDFMTFSTFIYLCIDTIGKFKEQLSTSYQHKI